MPRSETREKLIDEARRQADSLIYIMENAEGLSDSQILSLAAGATYIRQLCDALSVPPSPERGEDRFKEIAAKIMDGLRVITNFKGFILSGGVGREADERYVSCEVLTARIIDALRQAFASGRESMRKDGEG